MNWLRLHRRSALIVGATLILPLLLYINTLLSLVGMRQAFQAEIDGLTPRIARLQGLVEHEAQLQSSSGDIEKKVVNLVYPATQDRTTVSASLQKDVRQILTDAGLSVSNSQVLPVREREAFDYIAVKLTVSGDVPSLDAALAAIAAFMPLVLVESLDVWPKRLSRRAVGTDNQSINATLQLLSLRSLQ